MPLDAVFLSHLKEELDNRITGAKIEKIRQPEKDSIVLALHSQRENVRLLICFNASCARVTLTESNFENPAQPPMFCMLLRKYLTGAQITGIEQPEGERILILSLLTNNDFGEKEPKKLVMEFIGRNANVILLDEEGRILDAGRRVYPEMNPVRQILPGLLYRLPPRPEDIHYSGLSPLLERECEFRELPASPETVKEWNSRPVLLLENGQMKDFSFTDILQYGPSVCCEPYDSYCELLEAFYAEKDRVNHLKSRGKSLAKMVRGAISRTEKKLSLRLEEMRQTGNKEEDKKQGDLITANIWQIQKNQTKLLCEDFYQENSPTVEIKLDPQKSPQQNAAACYKRYTKKKTAEEHLNKLIAENEEELEYLCSVADELNRAESVQELEEIRRELVLGGYIREQKKGKQKKPPLSKPLEYVSPGGKIVLVGKNNIQNDELTFHTARRTDYWFHVLKIHGAHVVLCCDGEEPAQEDIVFAANLAARHSEAEQGKVPVDYTQIRFVKKPGGARAGRVVYTNQKTIMAEGE